jgi:general secretion pathway protein E
MSAVPLPSTLPVETAELMYFDEKTSTLYVSADHRFQPTVRAACKNIQTQVEREGRTLETLHVTLDALEVHRSGKVNSKNLVDQNLNDSQMQRTAMSIFSEAFNRKASDIHIRVAKGSKTTILFRIHGDMMVFSENLDSWGEQLCSAIYSAMVSTSDSTYEKNSRQDARISARSKLPQGLDGIRVATAPTPNGTLMVLRLLYNDGDKRLELSDLGYSPDQIDDIDTLKKSPVGVIIIGGETGSGKSTSLQTILIDIYKKSEGQKHIITVEDPPEYPMPGVVQTAVTNARDSKDRSEAFNAAIRSTLRLDPDIIMIGEVRDGASAQLAIEAAMTGHQVWTTLHINSALDGLSRLLKLQVELFDATDPNLIRGLVCQKLVKVICPACKVNISKVLKNYDQEDLQRISKVANLDDVYVQNPAPSKECPRCKGDAIVGRTVCAEVIITNTEMMRLYGAGKRAAAYAYWKRAGGSSMMDEAIRKVRLGLVDPFHAEASLGPLTLDEIDDEPEVNGAKPKASIEEAQ